MSAQVASRKGNQVALYETRALKGLLVRDGVETSTAQAACGLLPYRDAGVDAQRWPRREARERRFGLRVVALKRGATAAGVERVQIGDDRTREVLGWVSRKCLEELEGVPRPGATPASASELLSHVEAKTGLVSARAALGKIHENAAAALRERGMDWLAPLLEPDGPQLAIRDGFLGRPAALRACAAASLYRAGGVATTRTSDADRRKAVGLRSVQSGVRGDRVSFLRALDGGGLGVIEALENGGQRGAPRRVHDDYAESVSGPLRAVMAAFDAIRDALRAALEEVPYDDRSTYTPALLDGISGLGKHEDLDLEAPDDVQLAAYAAGEMGYRVHRDTMDEHTTFPPRLFTMIYYLNPDYREPDAGKLKLYVGRSATDLAGVHNVTAPISCPSVEVGPAFDRIVIFRSSSFHEVLPANAPRLAVTQWLAGRPPKKRPGY